MMKIVKSVEIKGQYVTATLEGHRLCYKVAGHESTGVVSQLLPEIRKKIETARGVQIELEFLIREIENMPMEGSECRAVIEAMTAPVTEPEPPVKQATIEPTPEQRKALEAVKYLPDGQVEITCIGNGSGEATRYARSILYRANQDIRIDDSRPMTIKRDSAYADSVGHYKYALRAFTRPRVAAYSPKRLPEGMKKGVRRTREQLKKASYPPVPCGLK